MADIIDYPGRFGRTAEIETEWGEMLVLRELTADEALRFWPDFVELEKQSKAGSEEREPPILAYATIVCAGAVKADFSPRFPSVSEVMEIPPRILTSLAMDILRLSEISLDEPEKKDEGVQGEG